MSALASIITPWLLRDRRRGVTARNGAEELVRPRQAKWCAKPCGSLMPMNRVRATTLAKLRADVKAGWKDVQDGTVSDFDPEDVKRRGRETLRRMKSGKR